MTLPTANNLETGLIPREDFARRRWYHASNLWYYHRPAPIPELHPDQQFYELVDADIRDLCRFLHLHGISTTPSCSGHFHSSAHLLQVWEELQHEADQIRSTGLIVQDCETRENLLFRNPSHALPWDSFPEFREHVHASQTGGYLGVIFRNDMAGIREQFARDNPSEPHAAYEPETPNTHGNWILHILVDAPTPDEQTHQWTQIMHHLRQALQTAHRPPVVPLPGVLHS
jgi:hypothetical protein